MEEIVVAKTADIKPGERKFFDINGIEIAVLNVDGDYHAVRNSCPHMGAPVARGPVEPNETDDCGGYILSCPFHEWRFDLESGESVFSKNARLKKYAVRVVDDEIRLRL